MLILREPALDLSFGALVTASTRARASPLTPEAVKKLTAHEAGLQFPFDLG
jgi:hypothetical protein